MYLSDLCVCVCVCVHTHTWVCMFRYFLIIFNNFGVCVCVCIYLSIWKIFDSQAYLVKPLRYTSLMLPWLLYPKLFVLWKAVLLSMSSEDKWYPCEIMSSDLVIDSFLFACLLIYPRGNKFIQAIELFSSGKKVQRYLGLQDSQLHGLCS